MKREHEKGNSQIDRERKSETSALNQHSKYVPSENVPLDGNRNTRDPLDDNDGGSFFPTQLFSALIMFFIFCVHNTVYSTRYMCVYMCYI